MAQLLGESMFEISSQGPAPIKDYFSLQITQTEVRSLQKRRRFISAQLYYSRKHGVIKRPAARANDFRFPCLFSKQISVSLSAALALFHPSLNTSFIHYFMSAHTLILLFYQEYRGIYRIPQH